MNVNLNQQLREIVAQFQDFAFLVDFDGTLVDLVPNPRKITVPDDLISDLNAISHSKYCAFAIVTGRPLAQLDNFLGGLSMNAVGSHGAECRPSYGSTIQLLTSHIPTEICEAVHHLSNQHSCYFEDKASSLSLHLPFTHAADDIMVEILHAIGKDQHNYLIRKVGRTYEILQSGITKGSGIVHLMKQPGFSGRRPVYIGDDVNIDESLHVVTKMNGVLIPTKHIHHQVPHSNAHALETEDVRKMVAELSSVAQHMPAHDMHFSKNLELAGTQLPKNT